MQKAIPLGGECLKSCSEDVLRSEERLPLQGDNRIESASAMLAGEARLVLVGYRTALPATQSSRSGSIFVLDQKSGQRLGIQNVPLIGALASRPVGRRKCCDGYFAADNSEQAVGPGSLITVVIGDMKIENIVVSG